MKKVARLYFGVTSNPEETTYKLLKDNWNKIVEEGINYENLEKFDWEKWKGTFLEEQAKEVFTCCQSLYQRNTFPREDLRELLSLVIVWLGGDVEGFHFLYPGAMSHARFLMQSIYSLKISLLSKQLDLFTEDELTKIKNVALFVGLFHAPWYFKSPLASSAPMLHLTTISQMKRLGEIFPDLSKVVLDSINLHLWYLTPQSVPLSLTDTALSLLMSERAWL